jgi:hypothetical protein
MNSNNTPKTIRVTREQIQSTKAFQNATKMIQQLTLNRTNSNGIQHGVNVSVNIGFDKWNAQTEASFTNTKIIKELVDNYLIKNPS